MTWTDKHAAAAKAEGWELSAVIDNGKPVKSWYYQIFDAGGPFTSRGHAAQFVVARAKQRSGLHILALQTCAASRAKNSR